MFFHNEKWFIFNLSKVRVQKKKKLIEFSIKGWVDVSGGGQILLKKNKKNMPLKSFKAILSHFRPIFFPFLGDQTLNQAAPMLHPLLQPITNSHHPRYHPHPSLPTLSLLTTTTAIHHCYHSPVHFVLLLCTVSLNWIWEKKMSQRYAVYF